MITNQRLFDQAALGIVSQDFKAAWVYDFGSVLLTDTGLRCTIGHCVTDATVNQKISGQSHMLLTNSPLARDLQLAHDENAAHTGRLNPILWQRRMSKIAMKYGLDDSVVYFSRKEK